jgi:hypothetical protein
MIKVDPVKVLFVLIQDQLRLYGICAVVLQTIKVMLNQLLLTDNQTDVYPYKQLKYKCE